MWKFKVPITCFILNGIFEFIQHSLVINDILQYLFINVLNYEFYEACKTEAYYEITYIKSREWRKYVLKIVFRVCVQPVVTPGIHKEISNFRTTILAQTRFSSKWDASFVDLLYN